MQTHKYWLLFIVICSVLSLLMLGATMFFSAGLSSSLKDGSYESFAACLTGKNVVMYGEDTCAACQNEKNVFGAAFSQINYVNCAFHAATCTALGTNGYPTWTMRGTVVAEGFTTPAALAEITGCSLNPS